MTIYPANLERIEDVEGELCEVCNSAPRIRHYFKDGNKAGNVMCRNPVCHIWFSFQYNPSFFSSRGRA